MGVSIVGGKSRRPRRTPKAFNMSARATGPGNWGTAPRTPCQGMARCADRHGIRRFPPFSGLGIPPAVRPAAELPGAIRPKRGPRPPVHPTGLEPVTFGSVDRTASDTRCYVSTSCGIPENDLAFCLALLERVRPELGVVVGAWDQLARPIQRAMLALAEDTR